MSFGKQPTDSNGRFVNLENHRIKPLSDILKWALFEKLRGRRRKSPDRAPVGVMKPDLARLGTPPAVGEPARLTWLGHSSWLVQLDGVSLLTDPALKAYVFPRIPRNVPPGMQISELPKIDASLVSHSHYDHLDLPTVEEVGAPILSGAGIGGYLRKRGMTCTELHWWESAQVGPVKVTFVPAQHWSRRFSIDTNRSLWGGFVIEGSRATLYHSGDTAYFSGFAEIGRQFAIDGAMLPIGAYDPEWFMREQHMNPDDAIQAFVDLRARTFLAMHWGTFKLTDEPLDEPPQLLREGWEKRGLEPESCRVLSVGETVEISRPRA